MKKIIIISESEKKTILKMYGLLKEDDPKKGIKVGTTFKDNENKFLYKIKSFYEETKEYDITFTDISNGRSNDSRMDESWILNNWNEGKLITITLDEYNESLVKIKKSNSENTQDKNNNTEKETTNKTTKNDSDESITISGIVKQGTIDGKKGVVDAIVTIEEKDDENNSKSAETDGNGAFKVVLPYVGKYKVTVEKKGFQSYSKTFNFNDDVTFNIPLSPKKGIIPKIKRGVQNIIDKLKDYYDTRDPKEDDAIVFTKYSDYREKNLWEESESQQEYCRNFTEYYYNFIIETNSDTKNAEQANSWAPDDEKLNQAKNFIMFCKKQYGNKLFASSIETKRKFDKIFTTLQNLPPKVKRYQI